MYFNGQNNNTKNTKTMVIIKTTNESPTMSINVHIRKFNFLIKNKMFPHWMTNAILGLALYPRFVSSKLLWCAQPPWTFEL
jgi:hypothetical protein